MNFRCISSSCKRKSSTPFSCSSSHQNNNNPLSMLNNSFNNNNNDGDGDDAAERAFCCRFIGPPPSQTEVHHALSSLQRVLGSTSRIEPFRDTYCDKPENEQGHVSKDEADTDWLEPTLFPYNPIMLQANGSDRVFFAIHLLQTDPSVQRLVKSLSTDEAVWEAVLNNEVVQELRESISADQEHVLQSLDEIANDNPHNTTNVLIWLVNTARAKFMEVIEKITKIVINFFQDSFNKTAADTEDSKPFNEKLRVSFMLSIMVLLIVVVSRVQS
ncbi:uncharacterized protein [Cicer arietinum]|uniref:Uncharacterized protein LOC101505422 isoform X2 n=1 Tax=Cicer arietinum TaxID=3827 RepID=A0A1S2Z3Q9_CICAR|nr:uncharacterized protein LOC101505422 isoform X2 [Cicer arietinum]